MSGRFWDTAMTFVTRQFQERAENGTESLHGQHLPRLQLKVLVNLLSSILYLCKVQVERH